MSNSRFIKRIIANIWTSIWLKFLLLLAAVLIYNQLCYSQHWVTSRATPQFGDTAAPLYAHVEDWIQEAQAEAHPDVDQQPPQGIWDLVQQLDAPAREAIAEVMKQRMSLLLTPLIWFGLIGGAVVAQLAKRQQIAHWAIAAALPVLALAVNVSVAKIDGGNEALVAPFRRMDLEFIGDVHRVDDKPIEFIRNYPALASISDYAFKLRHHTRTHPPGAVLFLWWVGKYIDPDIHTAAWAAMIVSALAALPAYLLARHRFGDTAGLLAAGMYLFTPSLVMFGATCMDGVFALPLITSLWLLVASLIRRFDDPMPYRVWPGWRSVIYAVLAGISLTIAAFMSYATLCIGVVIGIFLLAQLCISWRWFIRSVIVMAVVTIVFGAGNLWLHWATGYDPIACVQESMRADESVVGFIRRHWVDVSFANGIAFLIGAGLITTTLWLDAVRSSISSVIRRDGATRLSSTLRLRPEGSSWKSSGVFEIAMFAAIVTLSFSRLFTLETERIWIFLIPLLVAPAANQLVRTSQSTTALAIRSAGVLMLLMAQTWLCELVLNTWW